MADDTWTTIVWNVQYDGMAFDFSAMPDGELRTCFP